MTTGLIRRAPQSDFFRNRFSNFLGPTFGDFFTAVDPGEDVSNQAWLPAVDIRESDDSLVLSAELPGLGADDVEITLENNVLTLRGERKFEKTTENESLHRVERRYGAFQRSFTLPNNVKTDSVGASFENGLLRVEIPKVEEAKPRKIKIS